MFRRMVLAEATRPGFTGPRLVLQVVSVLLLVATVALFCTGIWLLMRPPYVFGLAFILVGIELRPRVEKVKSTDTVLTAVQAPVTFELLARVAAALSAARAAIGPFVLTPGR